MLAPHLSERGQATDLRRHDREIWALHDAMPEHLRPAVLLGAFAGLRLAEACGLQVEDVDFMRGAISPAVQYPAEPLRSETSRTAIPIPQTLALQLSAHHAAFRAETLLVNEYGRQLAPWTLERAMRAARTKVPGRRRRCASTT